MQEITEEMGIHEEWMVEAKQMNMEKLPEFLRKLTEDYNHDYGTICHAMAAAAIAAAWAVERSDQGGITGFQAGCVMWEMIEGWGTFDEGPKRMLAYKNMLYPQYANRFDRTISPDTWKWLREKAAESLKEPVMHDDVRNHMRSIVDGKVPFGFRISED